MLQAQKHIPVQIMAKKILSLFEIAGASRKMQEGPKKWAIQKHDPGSTTKIDIKGRDTYFWTTSRYRNIFPPAFFSHVPGFYELTFVNKDVLAQEISRTLDSIPNIFVVGLVSSEL